MPRPSLSSIDLLNQKLIFSQSAVARKVSHFLNFLSTFKCLRMDNTAALRNAAIHFGSPKSSGKSVGGMHPQYALSRILMREPNENVRNHMELLHAQIKDKFGNMSNPSLDWLLGGSRKTSRGGFRTVAEFKQFLNTPSEKIPSSHLISGLASILAAIGYRHVRAGWSEDPRYPGKESAKIAAVIDHIMYKETTPPINEIFPERAEESQISNKEFNSENLFAVKARRLSDASLSGEDAQSQQPLHPTVNQTFKKYNSQGQLSWVGQAHQQGIHVRAHISGTTARCCAAIQGLLRDPQGHHLLNEKEARELYTTLLIPHLFRSDYHSIAETQAGIEYYIDESKYQHGLKKQHARALPAQQAFERGINAMINSIRNTRRPEEKYSPQEAAATLFKKNIPRSPTEDKTTEFHKKIYILKSYLELNNIDIEVLESVPADYHRRPAIWPRLDGKVGIFVPSKNYSTNKKEDLFDTTKAKNYFSFTDPIEAKKFILKYL